MDQLTPEAIALIKKNARCFFEIQELWGKHRATIYRWLQQNKRPELSHPKTVKIITRHKNGNLKILALKKQS